MAANVLSLLVPLPSLRYNVGLTPRPAEVQEAQRILAYFAQLDERGEVEGALDGRLVDTYEAARATELLEWSALCAQSMSAAASCQLCYGVQKSTAAF